MKIFLEAYRAYREIMHKGEIKSMAEGDTVCFQVQGNICGDILVFFSPKNKISAADSIISLIQSDLLLEQQINEAMQTFRQKLNGLTLLPKSIVWVFYLVLAGIYISWQSAGFCRMFAGNDILTGIRNSLPLVAAAALAFFLGKRAGFWLLKPILYILLQFARIIRRVRNRKVREL